MRAVILAVLLSGCTVTVRHEVDRDQLARVEALARPQCPECRCPETYSIIYTPTLNDTHPEPTPTPEEPTE